MSFDANYVKWAQRSLNRIMKKQIPVNGVREGNTAYLNAIREFKDTYNISEAGLTSEQIGTKCQDEIIRFNNIGGDGGDYIAWLCKVVPNAPSQAQSVTDQLQSAVRKFQMNQKLKVDGWVGYKTEFQLMQVSKTDPPGTKPNDTPKGGGLPSPWVIWFNSLPPIKRYGHMMELVAKQFAEQPMNESIRCLSQKLRLTPMGIPNIYFFTSEQATHLVKPSEIKDSPSWQNYEELRIYIKPAKSIFGRSYYDFKDPRVQKIVMKHYMTTTASMLNLYYAHQVRSMADYEFKFQRFIKRVKDINDEIVLGINKVKDLRNITHGEPPAQLAQNLIVYLSQKNDHVYSCYQQMMPGGFEGPF